MTSDCLPHSGTRSIASKAFESSSSPKRSSRRIPTMPALNTAPTRRPSRRTRRATAPNTAPPPPLLLPRAPRPTAPSRAARTSWSAPRFSSCLEVRAHHDAPAARHASAHHDAPLRGMQVLTTTPDPLPSPQARSSRTLRPRTSSSCMSGCGERMRPWSTSRTSSRLRLPSQPAWSR